MTDTNNTPSTPQQGENKPSGKVFTQEEVNSIVAERLARERAKTASNVADLEAREKDLKAKEADFLARSERFRAWESKEACRQYLTDNHISEKLLDKIDTANPEEFKKAVELVQAVSGNGYTVRSVTKGASVANPPTVDNSGALDDRLKDVFGLKK